jgi:hypothetical protein
VQVSGRIAVDTFIAARSSYENVILRLFILFLVDYFNQK